MLLTAEKFASRLSYAWRTFALRRKPPYLFGLVISERCNLDCYYCTSKNPVEYHCSFDQAREALARAYGRGHRALYFTGGEPLLWTDSGRGLGDLVSYARELGFHDVFIFTNGTLPLAIPRCHYIVTVDGPKELHDRIRGGTFDLIMDNARRAATKAVFATMTFTRHNADYAERFVREISALGLFRGISFNLLTHGPRIVAEHGVNAEERIALLDRLWSLKRAGYPIVLSRAAYLALRRNDWERPISQIELGTNKKVFTCCRDVGTSVCDHCGYPFCVEVSQMLALKPSALWQELRMVD